MDEKTAVSNSAFAYSVNLLCLLLEMKLITEDEYKRIMKINAEHYGVKIICV